MTCGMTCGMRLGASAIMWVSIVCRAQLLDPAAPTIYVGAATNEMLDGAACTNLITQLAQPTRVTNVNLDTNASPAYVYIALDMDLGAGYYSTNRIEAGFVANGVPIEMDTNATYSMNGYHFNLLTINNRPFRVFRFLLATTNSIRLILR